MQPSAIQDSSPLSLLNMVLYLAQQSNDSTLKATLNKRLYLPKKITAPMFDQRRRFLSFRLSVPLLYSLLSNLQPSTHAQAAANSRALNACLVAVNRCAGIWRTLSQTHLDSAVGDTHAVIGCAIPIGITNCALRRLTRHRTCWNRAPRRILSERSRASWYTLILHKKAPAPPKKSRGSSHYE